MPKLIDKTQAMDINAKDGQAKPVKIDNTIVVRGGVIPPEVSQRISEELFKKYGTPAVSATSGAILSRVLYPIARFGLTNGNSRIYDKEIYTDNVLTDEQVLNSLKMRNMFMQEEHPPEGTEDDKTVTSRIAGIVCDIIVTGHNNTGAYGELELEDEAAYAIVDVLNTPMGRIVDTLIQAGAGFGVSTRASGTTESVEVDGSMLDKVKVKDYVFESIDFTATPSTHKVLPVLMERKIVERIEEALKYNAISKQLAASLLEACKTDKAQKLYETIYKELQTSRINEGDKMAKNKDTKIDEAKEKPVVQAKGQDKAYTASLVGSNGNIVTLEYTEDSQEKAEEFAEKVKELMGDSDEVEVTVEPQVEEPTEEIVAGEENLEDKDAAPVEPESTPAVDPLADLSKDDIDGPEVLKKNKKVDPFEDRILEYMQAVDPTLKMSESLFGALPNLAKLNESSSKDKVLFKRITHVLHESIKRIAISESEKNKALELLEEATEGMDGVEGGEVAPAVQATGDVVPNLSADTLALEEAVALKGEENKRLEADLDEAMNKVNSIRGKLEEAVKVSVRETKAAYDDKFKDLKESLDTANKELGILREGMDKKVSLARELEKRICESGLDLADEQVTLLRESTSIAQLEKRLLSVKKSLREGLHFSPKVERIKLTESERVEKVVTSSPIEGEGMRQMQMLVGSII